MSVSISDITNPEHLEKVKKAVEEAVHLQYQAESIRIQIKDIGDMLKHKFDISVSEFNSVVRTVAKENLNEQVDKVAALEEAIQSLGLDKYT